jgi:uncharacterized membrane protein YhfC
MTLFAPENRGKSPKHARIYAAYEIAFTLVDVLAALCFVVGSWLFFYKSWETVATWLFLVGSVFFALKPTIRIAREIHYFQLGKVDKLAHNLENEVD